MSPKVAHRVYSRQRSTSVGFGAKRTLVLAAVVAVTRQADDQAANARA